MRLEDFKQIDNYKLPITTSTKATGILQGKAEDFKQIDNYKLPITTTTRASAILQGKIPKIPNPNQASHRY